jgi:hypothetical protein
MFGAKCSGSRSQNDSRDSGRRHHQRQRRRGPNVTMLLKKAEIPKEVRAKFEELGRPTIQVKYNYVAGVKRLDDQDKKDEPLGGGVTASGREMREWLAEQASRDACWRNA